MYHVILYISFTLMFVFCLHFVKFRSTSAFGDRTRASWKRRLFPSVSVADDEASGSTSTDIVFAADVPSGLFVLILHNRCV